MLREYKIGAFTYLLNEADAERMGGVLTEAPKPEVDAKPTDAKAAPAPANKARQSNKR